MPHVIALTTSSFFVTKLKPVKNVKIVVANGSTLKVKGSGTIAIPYEHKNKISYLIIKDVYYVPEMVINILSVSQMIERQHYATLFSGRKCYVFKNGRPRCNADLERGLFYLKYSNKSFTVSETSSEEQNVNSVKIEKVRKKNSLWHRRLIHINENKLQSIANNEAAHDFDYDSKVSLKLCEDCSKGKAKRLPFELHKTRAKEPLELIHTDVCYVGKRSLGNNKYFLLFIDDATSFIWCYPLEHKSQVFDVFKAWHIQISKQYSNFSLKKLRSDNGTEYINKNFKEYCEQNGLIHQTTCTYTPEQNGRAEVQNRILLNHVRSMLSESSLNSSFWAEALLTAVYIKNRTPTTSNPTKTPFELFFGKRPSYKNIKVFGCSAYYLDFHSKSKLDAKARKGIFVGYCLLSLGYRIYDVDKDCIVTSRHVKFDEGEFMHSNKDKIQECQLPNDSEESLSETENHNMKHPSITNVPSNKGIDSVPKTDNIELQESLELPKLSKSEISDIKSRYSPKTTSSGRISRPPDRYGDWMHNVNLDTEYDQNLSNHLVPDPNSYKQAIKSKDNEHWKNAMCEEINSMYKNQAWKLVDPPKGASIVGCRWVYKKKLDNKGKLVKYKARLVAQGFSQKYGSNFDEVYSPVVKFNSIRTLIAIAAAQNLHMQQLDITTAFLNGTLTEEVYMKQPEGFIDSDHPEKVCKLYRSIYGLKQSPLVWNQTIDKFLKEKGFIQSSSDNCIYTLFHQGSILFLALYVDDIILCGSSKKLIDEVKSQLKSKFALKDLGDLNNFLAIQIENKDKGIFIHQKQYANKLLSQLKLNECNSTTLPAQPNKKLNERSKTEDPVDQTMYKSAIGSLLYLANMTRPDLAYTVNYAARY